MSLHAFESFRELINSKCSIRKQMGFVERSEASEIAWKSNFPKIVFCWALSKCNFKTENQIYWIGDMANNSFSVCILIKRQSWWDIYIDLSQPFRCLLTNRYTNRSVQFDSLYTFMQFMEIAEIYFILLLCIEESIYKNIVCQSMIASLPILLCCIDTRYIIQNVTSKNIKN